MNKNDKNQTDEPIRDGGLASVMRQGLSRSLVSLVIKIATAGLTYLMFVVLSRFMGITEYGLFAFGFALATVLAIGASFGQQTAILRFWPEYETRDDTVGKHGALQAGWALTLLAGLGLMLALGAVAFVIGWFNGGVGNQLHLLAAALLILPMGVAEYASSALRAQGSVFTALLPRDIAWRFCFPLIVVVFVVMGFELTGALALLIAALSLAVVMVLQFWFARRRGYYNEIGFKPVAAYWGVHGVASLWFFVGTVIDSAALNLDIVLVGIFVASESAGIYFNAFRTAGLMTLFMFAITLVIAPMVARHYHSGEIKKAQGVTTLCAWAGFLFSLVIFALFVFFGDVVLSLFGPEFSDGHAILVILSIGLLADAATGPTRIVMMMTGHERQYVSLFGSIMAVGFVVQLVVIPIYGVMGAAIVNALSRVVAQTVIAVWTTRKVGIDTSLLGIGRLFTK